MLLTNLHVEFMKFDTVKTETSLNEKVEIYTEFQNISRLCEFDGPNGYITCVT